MTPAEPVKEQDLTPQDGEKVEAPAPEASPFALFEEVGQATAECRKPAQKRWQEINERTNDPEDPASKAGTELSETLIQKRKLLQISSGAQGYLEEGLTAQLGQVADSLPAILSVVSEAVRDLMEQGPRSIIGPYEGDYRVLEEAERRRKGEDCVVCLRAAMVSVAEHSLEREDYRTAQRALQAGRILLREGEVPPGVEATLAKALGEVNLEKAEDQVLEQVVDFGAMVSLSSEEREAARASTKPTTLQHAWLTGEKARQTLEKRNRAREQERRGAREQERREETAKETWTTQVKFAQEQRKAYGYFKRSLLSHLPTRPALAEEGLLAEVLREKPALLTKAEDSFVSERYDYSRAMALYLKVIKEQEGTIVDFLAGRLYADQGGKRKEEYAPALWRAEVGDWVEREINAFAVGTFLGLSQELEEIEQSQERVNKDLKRLNIEAAARLVEVIGAEQVGQIWQNKLPEEIPLTLALVIEEMERWASGKGAKRERIAFATDVWQQIQINRAATQKREQQARVAEMQRREEAQEARDGLQTQLVEAEMLTMEVAQQVGRMEGLGEVVTKDVPTAEVMEIDFKGGAFRLKEEVTLEPLRQRLATLQTEAATLSEKRQEAVKAGDTMKQRELEEAVLHNHQEQGKISAQQQFWQRMGQELSPLHPTVEQQGRLLKRPILVIEERQIDGVLERLNIRGRKRMSIDQRQQLRELIEPNALRQRHQLEDQLAELKEDQLPSPQLTKNITSLRGNLQRRVREAENFVLIEQNAALTGFFEQLKAFLRQNPRAHLKYSSYSY